MFMLCTISCVDMLMFLQLYSCDLIVKLTLSACVWRWSCTRYTGADSVDAGGSGDA